MSDDIRIARMVTVAIVVCFVSLVCGITYGCHRDADLVEACLKAGNSMAECTVRR